MSVPSGQHILVVEDEEATRSLITTYLEQFGYRLTIADSAAQFRRVIQRGSFDLVLMDRRLPDGDGLDLARELRQVSNAGIIFVTAVGGEIESVLGLEIGADDYIVKPIALRELVARVRSTLRRVQATPSRSDERRARLGPWTVDFGRRLVLDSEDTELTLTRGEYDLLAALVEAKGRPLNRDYLLELVSDRAEAVTDRSIDTLISRLRKKLGPGADGQPLIVTERGIGYRARLVG
ncbi:MAG: DNA-binding response regulator [Alphaproteobacteria bacterium]|nr:response regulator transcription factor [Alphaproteobacteria bacterium]TAD90867.1 MAG: DNA-binding response regulator [Alphaproteobacteria bacterium]